MQKALDNANTALVLLLTEEGQLVLPFSGLQQISLFLKKERAKKDRTEIDQCAKKKKKISYGKILLTEQAGNVNSRRKKSCAEGRFWPPVYLFPQKSNDQLNQKPEVQHD